MTPMFKEIISSNKTLDNKLEELRKFTTSTAFLDIMISPAEFLADFLPFARKVFDQFPPDSAYQFGPSNDTRVFIIRLLSRLNYSNYRSPDIIHLAYELLASENVFNRYLTLKILFPVLESQIEINFQIHLRVINTFFINELPSGDTQDLSKCELGFFSAADALSYLTLFQEKYSLDISFYDEIFANICRGLRTYFGSSGYIDKYRFNKKIVCEYSSFSIKLLEFTNILKINGQHIIFNFVPEICYSLAFLCPSDCYYLRKDAIKTIVNTCYIRRDLPYAIEKYFAKTTFTMTEFDPLKIYILLYLCDFLVIFNKTISKHVFLEFDNRISEFIPQNNYLPLLSACVSSYTVNLNYLQKIVIDPVEIRFLVTKQLKHALDIYNSFHSNNTTQSNCQDDIYKGFETKLVTTKEFLDGFLEYIKSILRAIGSLRLPSGALDMEDINILCILLLFPLNFDIPNVRDYLHLFFEINIDDLEQILSSVVKDLIIKYYNKEFIWNVFSENIVTHFVIIREANKLIHKDFSFFNYKSIHFYEKILPVAYGFFKLDKKFYKNDFSEYFTVTYDCILNYRPVIMSYIDDCDHKRGVKPQYSHSLKENFALLNKMFLDVKGSENSAYTGLYFIYNNFEKTVKELYTLFCLTNDTIFIEYLFNIPVSLNLLVTKYQILLKAMGAGLRCSKRLKEIVLKYIEYIIEFDNEDGIMDELLYRIYMLLEENGLKAINVLSRLSNSHRESLCTAKNRTSTFPNSSGLSISCVYSEDFDKESSDKNSQNHLNGLGKYVIISIDNTIRSMIKNLIGYEFIYDNVDIRGRPYRVISTRSLKSVDVDPASRSIAREHLLNYMVNIQGFKEFGVFNAIKSCEYISMDALFKEIIDKYYMNEVFPLALYGKDGLDFYSRMNQTGEDIMVAFFIDDDIRTMNFLRIASMIYSFYRRKFQEKKYDQKIIAYLHRVFSGALIDGMIYANERAEKIVMGYFKLIDDSGFSYSYKSNFAEERIADLCNLVYMDDHRSIRALSAIKFYIGSVAYMNESILKPIMHAIHFRLKSANHRIYDLCLELVVALFRAFGSKARQYFERIFTDSNVYVKTMYNEAQFLFDLNVHSDVLAEMDRRFILRVLNYDITVLQRYTNLTSMTENLLKSIEKKDTFAISAYINFLNKMSGNKNLYREILAPAKKYLPAVAVLEGFPSLEAKRKFVETVNKNGNPQNGNPNSFKVFRNLFYNCRVSNALKTNFISLYNNQNSEHKKTIYEIILGCIEQDGPSLDFIFDKLNQIAPSFDISSYFGIHSSIFEIFSILKAVIYEDSAVSRQPITAHYSPLAQNNYNGYSQNFFPNNYNSMMPNYNYNGFNQGSAPAAINSMPNNIMMNSGNFYNSNIDSDVFLRYILNRIHELFVFYFTILCIQPTQGNLNIMHMYLDDYTIKMASGNCGVMECITLSKGAYNVVRYLLSRRIRCNNNKTILILYKILRDSNCLDNSIESIVNWYAKVFSTEDIECLFRINPSFNLSPSIVLEKIKTIEIASVKTWMIGCLKRNLNFIQEADPDPDFNYVNLQPSHGVKYDSHHKEEEPELHKDILELSDVSDFSLFYSESEEDDRSSTDSYVSVPDISLSSSSEDLQEKALQKFEELELEEAENNVSNNDLKVFLNKQSHESFADYYLLKKNYIQSFINGDIAVNDNMIKQAVITENKRVSQTEKKTGKRLNNLKELLSQCQDNFVAVVEIFADMNVYSQELVMLCKQNLTNACARYIALYYLCKYEPLIEYFDQIFKLNFQERKYVEKSLDMLLSHFGYEPFIGTIKTVLRSEMRFKSTVYILVPLIAKHRDILKNSEVMFELAILSHRCAMRGHFDYDLLDIVQKSGLSKALTTELNTVFLLNELETGKFKLFNHTSDFHIQKIMQSRNIPKVFYLLDKYLESCNDMNLERVKVDAIRLFRNNKMVDLSKRVIEWMNLDLQEFTHSSLNNQMSALELSSNLNNCYDIVSSLVKGKYQNGERFMNFFNRLLSLKNIPEFFLSLIDDNSAVYPPLIELIPDVLNLAEPVTALAIYNKNILNMTQDQRDISTLHLFKKYPFSLNHLKKQFMNGLMSTTRYIRKSFLDIFVSTIPQNIYLILEFILRFDYSGLDERTIEYIVINALYHGIYIERYNIKNILISCKNFNTNINRNNKARKSAKVPFVTSMDSVLFSFSKENLLDDMETLFYYSTDNSLSIADVLTGIFSDIVSGTNKQSMDRLVGLYYEQFRNNSYRIRLPFIKAFSSVDIDIEDIYYNPFRPSLRYYQAMGDRTMMYGMMKVSKGIRETKMIARLGLFEKTEECVSHIYDVFKGVQDRTISYRREDLKILETELYYHMSNNTNHFIQMNKNDLEKKNYVVYNSSKSITSEWNIENAMLCNSSNKNAFGSSYNFELEVEKIECEFNRILSSIISTSSISLSIVEDTKKLIANMNVLFYIPSSTLMFTRLLLYASMASEINESFTIMKDNLNDSIYGRFRMWMIRHPSYFSSMADWNVFIKWRSFIFNKAIGFVSDHDKKKISSEICRLNCLYATKAFKEKMYQRCSYILNDINSIGAIEVNQNLTKYLMDIEALFESGEYNTVITLINSINISRFSGEDKARLYNWAARAFKKLKRDAEADRFTALSCKMGDIIENKKFFVDSELKKYYESGNEGVGKKKIDCEIKNIHGSEEGLERKRLFIDQDISYNSSNDIDRSNFNSNFSIKNSAGLSIESSSPFSGNMSDKRYYSGFRDISPVDNMSKPSTDDSNFTFYNLIDKLIDLINELPIKDSRLYVIEFLKLKCFSKIEQIQPQKLYFFIPQITNTEFLTKKNTLLKTSLTSTDTFNALSFKYTTEWVNYHNLKDKFKSMLLSFKNDKKKPKYSNKLVNVSSRAEIDKNSTDQTNSDCKIDNSNALMDKVNNSFHSVSNFDQNSSTNDRKYSNRFNIDSASLFDSNTSQDIEANTDYEDNFSKNLKDIAESLFFLELKLSFEFGTSYSFQHCFDTEISLPGQFSILRNEYDNIKLMSYIEDFKTAYDAAENIFFVRNTDGTVSKVHLHNANSYYNPEEKLANDNGSDNESNMHMVNYNANLMQLIQMLNVTAKSHQLEKLNFGVPIIPILDFVSVHSTPDYSIDSCIKFQLFRKKIPLSDIVLKYVNDTRMSKKCSNSIDAFCKSIICWQDLFRTEIIERLVDSTMFYTYKKNFISSYSSIICIQNLIGINAINLNDTVIESMTGKAAMSFFSENNLSQRFYLRPNIGKMMGDEGKNGPLVLMIARFAESFLNSECSKIFGFFFGEENMFHAEKRMSKLVYNEVNSQDLLVADMVDPKNGILLPMNTMPWL